MSVIFVMTALISLLLNFGGSFFCVQDKIKKHAMIIMHITGIALRCLKILLTEYRNVVCFMLNRIGTVQESDTREDS